MFDVGLTELFFLAIIVVIVLGPERLPEAIRYASRLWIKFSHLKNDIQQKINLELELTQLKEELKGEIDNVKQLESQMQDYLTKFEADIREEQKKFYPIEKFEVKPPFKSDFLVQHLMSWPCLNLKAIGVQHV